MEYRKLGKNGLVVSALGLGCMGMSPETYGPTDQQSAKNTINYAYENGVTLFDTADIYGNGENERFLGPILGGLQRDKIVVATKCGLKEQETGLQINNTPEYIQQACDESLKRLGIDYIDLYYLHRYNPETPIEHSMQAMLALINAGKIRYVGLSEVDAPTIEHAYKILGDKLVAVQTEYSMMNYLAAETILPTCRKLGISFVPFSPIARGLLAGHITDPKVFKEHKEFDFRSILPQFQGECFEQNLRLIEAVKAIATKKHCTPAQLSLAWLLAQGEDIVPIPGTQKVNHLKENIAAAELKLSSDDLNLLAKARQTNPIKGARYPQALMEIFNLEV